MQLIAGWKRVWLIGAFVLVFVCVAATEFGRRPRPAIRNGSAIVEAAKKEGKVVVAGSPDPVMRNDIIPKFTARFGIPVEFIAGRSSQIVSRVETERAAGNLQHRHFSRRSGHHGQRALQREDDRPAQTVAGDAGSRRRLEVEDAAKFGSSTRKSSSSCGRLAASRLMLFINTEHVKPDEMRQMKDLLNPKWRGKISAEDPTDHRCRLQQGGAVLCADRRGVRAKIFTSIRRAVRTRERRQMTDWLARGTQPICLNCREDDVRPLIKDGFKILEIFEIAGIPADDQRFAVDAVVGQQSAAPEGGTGVCQLDSRQGRFGNLCQGLWIGDAAHRYRRIISQPRQFAQEGREVFRRHRLEVDRRRPARESRQGLEAFKGALGAPFQSFQGFQTFQESKII